MWNIETFAELPSTQTLARERFYLGTGKHGDVFVALHQTGGKGRYENRTWLDEAGANLLMSIILTEIPPHLQQKMQFVTALSVLRAIRKVISREISGFDTSRVQLKWTNDILIDGKKVSGILTEGIWSGDVLKGMIIGIGININQEIFSEELADRAIALKHILKFSFPPDDVRDEVLALLHMHLASYTTLPELLHDVESELEWMHGLQSFSLTGISGTKEDGLRYDGITDDGAIRVILPSGEIKIHQNATLNFP